MGTKFDPSIERVEQVKYAYQFKASTVLAEEYSKLFTTNAADMYTASQISAVQTQAVRDIYANVSTWERQRITASYHFNSEYSSIVSANTVNTKTGIQTTPYLPTAYNGGKYSYDHSSGYWYEVMVRYIEFRFP